MKKIFALCLIMVMVVTMSVSALAAPSGFVSSPSANPSPTIVDFQPADEECTAELVITPYAESQELSDTLQNMLDKAYSMVIESSDLTTLNSKLAKIAADKNIASENLAISDLFDIHVTGCDFHEGHVDFDITLNAETLSHFVGLLHMKKDGVWEWVEDARVVNNGEHLAFSVDSFSPFAIVVDTSKSTVKSPQTDDGSMIGVYAIIMAVSALAILVISVKSKKREA